MIALCYRSKRDINRVPMGCLPGMPTLLCKIVIGLEIPNLQWRQSFCLNMQQLYRRERQFLEIINIDKTFRFSLIVSYFFYLPFCKYFLVRQRTVCIIKVWVIRKSCRYINFQRSTNISKRRNRPNGQQESGKMSMFSLFYC